MSIDNTDFRSPMGQMAGKDAIRTFLGAFDAAFPGAQLDVERVIESGNTAVVEGAPRSGHPPRRRRSPLLG